MNDSAEPSSGLDARNPLMKWVDELQGVLKVVTSVLEESDRHRAIAESTQQKNAELREELRKLRAESEHYRGLAQSLQQELDRLHQSVAELRTENDRLRADQAEAGETAAKLLGEVKELVNQVAHKFQEPTRMSPIGREPRSPHA
jgi:chromosome segregation ATPase